MAPQSHSSPAQGAQHPPLLRLDPADNIAVATRDLAAGEAVRLGDIELRLQRATATGHKVAVRPIAAGEKIVKFRVPIGSATQPIGPGDYVHTHNLKSDYIATYTLDAARAKAEQA